MWISFTIFPHHSTIGAYIKFPYEKIWAFSFASSVTYIYKILQDPMYLCTYCYTVTKPSYPLENYIRRIIQEIEVFVGTQVCSDLDIGVGFFFIKMLIIATFPFNRLRGRTQTNQAFHRSHFIIVDLHNFVVYVSQSLEKSFMRRTTSRHPSHWIYRIYCNASPVRCKQRILKGNNAKILP